MSLRRSDVFDLVTEHFDAPGLRSLVEFVDHLNIDIRPLLKRPIEINLADLAAQCGLGQLGQGKVVIADAIGGPLGFETLRYRMPSTATCTLSRVMQTCSGMSIAVSLRECLYWTIDEREQDVETRSRVREYRPSRSTT